MLKNKDKEKTTEIIVSTFLLDDMEFGIDVNKVREALFFNGKIMHLPTELDIFEGVINLRGSIIPVMNMRKRFGLPQNENIISKCIAIVTYKNRYIGLVFDNISQVIRFKEEELNYFEENIQDNYFSNEGAKLIEDEEKLLQILNLDILFKDCKIPLIESSTIENQKKFLEVKQNITFMLDGQEYAFEVEDIQEIINISEIKNKVEHSPFIKGVISLRNELIPIVDFKKYLNGEDTQINKDSKIIILRDKPICGIIVDSIKEVIHYEIDKLLHLHKFENDLFANSFSNIIALSEERNIIKIKLNTLFSEDAKTQLKAGIHLNRDYKQNDEKELQDSNDENLIRNKDYIIFKIGETYALEINEFQEIIKYSSNIIKMPNSKNYLEGMINLRGEPVFIINLRKYYSLEDYPNLSESKILILNSKGQKFGIMVDEIIEILKTDKVQVSRSPSLMSRNILASMKNHINDLLLIKQNINKKVESQMVIVLNSKKIISSIELNLEEEQDEQIFPKNDSEKQYKEKESVEKDNKTEEETGSQNLNNNELACNREEN